MTDWIVYHHRRCSKSRQVLAILEDHDVEPQVIEYCKTPPDEAALRHLLQVLGCAPRDLIRDAEAMVQEIRLDLEDDAGVFRVLGEHPELLQRPIVVHGDRAVIARPAQRVLELLADDR